MNRPLAVDDIVVALTKGLCVAVTGLGDIAPVLEPVAAELASSGMRVLQFRPPLDAASFIQQFAGEWQMTGRSSRTRSVAALVLPEGASERVVILIHDAHRLPNDTLRHLEQFAQTWPWMQMAFTGRPGLIEAVTSDDLPTLKRRMWVFIEVPDTKNRLLRQTGGDELPPANPNASVLNASVLRDLFPIPNTTLRTSGCVGLVVGICVIAIAAILVATTPVVSAVCALVVQLSAAPDMVQSDPREAAASAAIGEGSPLAPPLPPDTPVEPTALAEPQAETSLATPAPVAMLPSDTPVAANAPPLVTLSGTMPVDTALEAVLPRPVIVPGPAVADTDAPMRRDFTAFLNRAGGDTAKLTPAARETLFREYLHWRARAPAEVPARGP